MAGEIFAKLGDIKGESTDNAHKDEIEIISFSWGITRPVAAGGAATGKATFHDFSFVHRIDKASPKLLEACATNRRLAEATVTHRKPGGAANEYLIIKFTDAMIVSVLLTDMSGGGSETVTLTFAKVDFEYKPQKADGSLDAGIHFKFDLKTNQVA